MDLIRKLFTALDVPIKIILFLGLFIEGYLIWQNNTQPPRSITKIISNSQTKSQPAQPQNIEDCGIICEQKIKDTVSRVVATLSAKLKETPVPTPTPKSQKFVQTQTKTSVKQISYIPIGGSGTTQKTDWDDLKNTDFYFDISEYGTVTNANWYANLKLDHGNGQAFARLYDTTHGVVVPGSEISTSSDTFTLVGSGDLSFLSGKNHYRVQLKSLSSFIVSYDAGSIKIISQQ